MLDCISEKLSIYGIDLRGPKRPARCYQFILERRGRQLPQKIV